MSPFSPLSRPRHVVLALSCALALSLVGVVFAPAALAHSDKRIDVRASIHVGPIELSDHECKTIKGVAGVPFRNTATLGTAPGDTWHSVGEVVDLTCVYVTADGVFYTGTEAGTVTIDGCGTGFVLLEFVGSIDAAGHERSFARLQPGRGTGDLKGVSGRVMSESTGEPGGPDSRLTGTVHCPRAKKR